MALLPGPRRLAMSVGVGVGLRVFAEMMENELTSRAKHAKLPPGPHRQPARHRSELGGA